MTPFDYAVLLIVGASVLVSVMRGLVREVLSLLGWLIALVAAALASPTVSEWMTGTIANESLRVLGAFVAVFVFTLVAMSLTAMAVSGLMRKAGLGLEDRMLGGVFGLARGVLIVMVFVLLAGLTSLPRQPLWNDAMLSPPLVALAGAVKPWLPSVVSRNLSYE
jgi:membrane protein required for colicin V production